MNVRGAVVEFIGVFALCFLGIGAVAVSVGSGADVVGPALAHGLALTVMITALAAVGPVHFNPAVTLALLATGKVKSSDAVTYIVAQVLGGIAGTAAVAYAHGSAAMTNIKHGIPSLGAGLGTTQGIVIEMILTMFLMLVVYGAAVDGRAPKGLAGLMIGSVVTADILMAGPLTGACMNPARYLGPAVTGGDFSQIAVFLTGPILGALVGAVLYRYVLAGDPEVPA
ncbi:MAG: aquaporin [Chthonomonas sp.]|nr:aquaporin [Chthonomonas sp.]